MTVCSIPNLPPNWQGDRLEDPQPIAGLYAKNIKPYTGIQMEAARTFEGHGSFLFFTYQAFDARGLIGSECNGICVVDLDVPTILCDEILKQSTGYFGPSQQQRDRMRWLAQATWEEFRDFINAQARCRYEI